MLVYCPACKAGMVPCPIDQRDSKREVCDYCDGRGLVNTDYVCVCGRPALHLWMNTHKELIAYCGIEKCRDHIDARIVNGFEDWVAAWEQPESFSPEAATG